MWKNLGWGFGKLSGKGDVKVVGWCRLLLYGYPGMFQAEKNSTTAQESCLLSLKAGVVKGEDTGREAGEEGKPRVSESLPVSSPVS